MNMMVKSVQKTHKYTGVQAFLGMTIVCTFLTAGVMISQTQHDPDESATAAVSSVETLKAVFAQLLIDGGDKWPLQLTLLAAMAYHIEYALNFVFSGYVSNVSFSVSDIARRICIICIGSVMFSKTLTGMNWLGIAIAISGVLWYTYLNDQETKQKTALEKKKYE
jgi:hypothetical protein